MLMNTRTHDVVASIVELPQTRAARRKGLLGRDGLDPAAALLLSPCFMIHTAGMRFPIDAMFVDRQGVVVRIACDIAPWSVAVSWSARAVIEFAAGTLRTRDVRIGDRLYLAPQPAVAGASASRRSA